LAEKILEIKNLEKKYDDKFCLNIKHLYSKSNRVLTIIGPNGSGKSTLIRLVNLLEKPDRGYIFFDGKEVSNSKINQSEVRKKMAVVFQEPLLFSTSVYANILMGVKIRKIKFFKVNDRYDYLINKLRLGSLLNRSIKDLSGGEKQRVSLARALVMDPKLLLLDEPLANIDQQSRESLRTDLFEVLKSFGKAIIYVTHDRNEAMILADEIAVINNGKIEQFGSKEEVFRRPVNEFVAKFVGVETIINGIVLESGNGVCRVRVKNNKNPGQFLEIFAASKISKGCKVMAAIRPEDVVLYNVDLLQGKSSALNLFHGRVSNIRDIGIFKKIDIDCGFKLVSFITQNSVERLGLGTGKKVDAAVKATSVHLFIK